MRNKYKKTKLNDEFFYYQGVMVSEELTLCGHSVNSLILDEMGYYDYISSICHHCKYYNNEIDEDFYNYLCEME